MSALPKSALPKILKSRAFAFAAGFALSVLAVFPFSSAKAQDLVVKYDQSQLIRLPRPVAEIIIGNPTIAEVTVQSANLLVVTGKTFGITNVIALDADRNIIQDQRIMVVRDENKTVSLMKAGKRESYNCAPQCNPALVVGDDKEFFETVAKVGERKMKYTEGADHSGQNGGGQ